MKVKSILTDLNTVKKRLQHDVLLDQFCCLMLYYRQLAKVAAVLTTVASLERKYFRLTVQNGNKSITEDTDCKPQ